MPSTCFVERGGCALLQFDRGAHCCAVVQGMLPGVLRGLNATVFAYGATGSGKTHTMVGDASDPGLMVLSVHDVFEHMVGGAHI